MDRVTRSATRSSSVTDIAELSLTDRGRKKKGQLAAPKKTVKVGQPIYEHPRSTVEDRLLLTPEVEDYDMALSEQYEPWNIQKKILTKQRFVKYKTLLDFVDNHRFIQFNVKANRDRIRGAYAALPTKAPFDRTIRFPEDDIYVHLDDGALDSWMSQLLQALDLPDRAIEKGTSSGTDVGDAKRSANVAFNELHKILVNVESLDKNGIYDRQSFESAFGLRWL